MRFPWQPREYARDCVECGYTWRVPRSASRRRFKTISAFMIAPGGRANSPGGVARAELSREIKSISAQNQSAEAFRYCPKCGAEHFTQHALRGKCPDRLSD